MLNPLWQPGNNTLHSAVFEVEDGTAIALFAVGLERFKVRQNSKEMQDLQRICVSRILCDYNAEPTRKAGKVGPAMNMCDCGFIFDATWLTEIELVEEVITSGGCPWQLTQCDNFRILVMPGRYRLHLNDDTAIGKAQVYAEQYAIENIPQQASSLFFG